MSGINQLLLRRSLAGSTFTSLANEMGVSITTVSKKVNFEMERIKRAVAAIPSNPNTAVSPEVHECLQNIELCYELGSSDVTVNLAGPPLYTIRRLYLG